MSHLDRNSIEYRKFTLKERVILLKAALLDVEKIVLQNKCSETIRTQIEDIVGEELNDPSPEDEAVIYKLRNQILKKKD